MTDNARTISDSELDVLKVLWELGPRTVRDLLEPLQQRGRDWAYTTVQTLLVRLVEKGFVKTERLGRAHVYAPAMTRDEFVDRQAGELAERVLDGRTSSLVLSLVEGRRFSKAEIKRFRDLLDRMEGERRRDR